MKLTSQTLERYDYRTVNIS